MVFENKVDEYLRLTDGILEKIEILYEDESYQRKCEEDPIFAGEDENKEFAEAYEILQKLRNRQIYDFVVESHQSYNAAEF